MLTDQSIELSAQRLNQARQALGAGEGDDAMKLLDEGLQLLDSSDPGDPRVLALKASLHEGLCVVYGQAGELAPATRHHDRVVALRGKLEDAGHGDQQTQLGITHMNLAHAHAADKDLDKAEGLARRAIARLEAADEVMATFFLVGAQQLLGTLLKAKDAPGPALDALLRAVEVARKLPEDAPEHIGGALVQALVNTSLAYFERGMHPQAVAHGEEAAQRAQALVERSSTPGPLELYLSAQMNLITFHQAAGSFSKGEDALFRVLDVVPGQPEVIARGVAFFEALLELSDETLEAGDLPRDEIEDSLSELRAMAEEAS